jgi:hypothetical protein
MIGGIGDNEGYRCRIGFRIGVILRGFCGQFAYSIKNINNSNRMMIKKYLLDVMIFDLLDM